MNFQLALLVFAHFTFLCFSSCACGQAPSHFPRAVQVSATPSLAKFRLSEIVLFPRLSPQSPSRAVRRLGVIFVFVLLVLLFLCCCTCVSVLVCA